MIRVLVTGDRHWTAREVTRGALIALLSAYRKEDLVIVHGANGYDAEGHSSWKTKRPTVRGADMIAHEEAIQLGLRAEGHPANWHIYGKSAGPRRNSFMLSTGIDIVLAFHDNLSVSKGTRDMLDKCRVKGVRWGGRYCSDGEVFCPECHNYTGRCPKCQRVPRP